MRKYWAKMEQWTIEQAHANTPKGRAEKARNVIIERALEKKLKRMKRRKLKQALNSGGDASLTPAEDAVTDGAGARTRKENARRDLARQLKPAASTLLKASLAGTSVLWKAKIRQLGRSNRESATKRTARMKKKKIKEKYRRPLDHEPGVFRDDELEKGDMVLCRWRGGRVAFPGTIVGVHYCHFVSQHTGEFVGHKHRTFDIRYDEDALLDLRVRFEYVVDIVQWHDEADKKLAKMEKERKKREIREKQRVKRLSKKQREAEEATERERARKIAEGKLRPIENREDSITAAAEKARKAKEEAGRGGRGWEPPDPRLADLIITTRAQGKHSRRERSLFARRKHEKAQLAIQRTAKTSLGLRTGVVELEIVVGESAVRDFTQRLERFKMRIEKHGVKLSDVPVHYPCHKYDLRLTKRKEAGDRLPVRIFAKKGPAARHMIELRLSRGWAKHRDECEQFQNKKAMEKFSKKALQSGFRMEHGKSAAAVTATHSNGGGRLGEAVASSNKNRGSPIEEAGNDDEIEEEDQDMSMQWHMTLPNRAKDSELPTSKDGMSGGLLIKQAQEGGPALAKLTRKKVVAPGPPQHWDRLPMVAWHRSDSVKRPIVDVRVSSVRLGAVEPRKQELKLFKQGYQRLPEDLAMFGCDKGTFLWVKYRDDSSKEEEKIVDRIAQIQNRSFRQSITTKRLLRDRAVEKQAAAQNAAAIVGGAVGENGKGERRKGGGKNLQDEKEDENVDGADTTATSAAEAEAEAEADTARKEGDKGRGIMEASMKRQDAEEHQAQDIGHASKRLWAMVDELALDDIEVMKLYEMYKAVDVFENGYVDLEDVLRHVGHTTAEMPALLEFFVQMACPGCEDDLGRSFAEEGVPGEGGYFAKQSKKRRLRDPVRFGDFVRILGVYNLMDTYHFVKLIWNYCDRDRGNTLFKDDILGLIHAVWSPHCAGDRLTLVGATQKRLHAMNIGNAENPFIHFKDWKELCQRFPRMILPLRKLQYSLSTRFMGVEWWDKKKLQMMKARKKIKKLLGVEERRKAAEKLIREEAGEAPSDEDSDEGDPETV